MTSTGSIVTGYLMYFKLSKALIIAVLGAVTCSAAFIVPRYENENNVPTNLEKGGDAQVNNGDMNVRMTDVCVVSLLHVSSGSQVSNFHPI